MNEKPIGLYEALLAARLELTGKVYKGSKNKAQDYSYIGHEGVIDVIRPVMLQHGLLLIEKSVTYVGNTGGDKAYGIWLGVFTLLHVPTGETLEATYSATTVANDKAAFVASTSLDRTAALRLMQLAGSSDKEAQQPFVEDPESPHSGTDQTLADEAKGRAEAAAEQKKQLAQAAAEQEKQLAQAVAGLKHCSSEAALTDWFTTLEGWDVSVEVKQRAARAFKARCDELKLMPKAIVDKVRSAKGM